LTPVRPSCLSLFSEFSVNEFSRFFSPFSLVCQRANHERRLNETTPFFFFFPKVEIRVLINFHPSPPVRSSSLQNIPVAFFFFPMKTVACFLVFRPSPEIEEVAFLIFGLVSGLSSQSPPPELTLGDLLLPTVVPRSAYFSNSLLRNLLKGDVGLGEICTISFFP